MKNIALATILLGWYLMAPPLLWVNATPKLLTDAPLYRWHRIEVFDAVESCRATRNFVREHGRNPDPERPGLSEQEQEVRCIATDDPGLTPLFP
jgi:hypothetical protein